MENNLNREQVKLNFCKLRLTEKYYINKALRNPLFLNNRPVFVKNCRNKCKLLLNFMKDGKRLVVLANV